MFAIMRTHTTRQDKRAHRVKKSQYSSDLRHEEPIQMDSTQEGALTIVSVRGSSGGGGPRHSAAKGLGVSGVLERSVAVVVLRVAPPRHGHRSSRTRVRRSALPGTQHGQVCQSLRGVVDARNARPRRRPGRGVVVRRVARRVSHRRAELGAFRAHVVPVIFPEIVEIRAAGGRGEGQFHG